MWAAKGCVESVFGRPKTDLIDRLRVIMWSHAVFKSSEAADIQALELELAKKYRIRLASGLSAWCNMAGFELVGIG